MQVAGDLAEGARWLVAEGDRTDADFAGDDAAEVGRQRRIVIARNPDPVAAGLHRRDGAAIDIGQAPMRVAVMKAVAERDDRAGIVTCDHGGEPAQRRGGVVGRQQYAARGEARAFLKVQVGYDEQALRFPIQRAGEIGDERDAGDINVACRSNGECNILRHDRA